MSEPCERSEQGPKRSGGRVGERLRRGDALSEWLALTMQGAEE
jgi:hypothetical protein